MERFEIQEDGSYLDEDGQWRNSDDLLIDGEGKVIPPDDGSRIAYIYVGEDGQVSGWGSSYSEGTVEYEYNAFEETPDILINTPVYRLIEGEFIKDEEVQQSLIDEAEYEENKPSDIKIMTSMLGSEDEYKKESIALQVNKAFEFLTVNLTEEQALQVPDLFEEWSAGAEYKPDKRLKVTCDENNTTLYEVLQQHTSQEGWPPKDTPALYKEISKTEGGYDVWVQPLGGTDAYNTGDIVSYEDVLYISIVDNNVWEPGVYGWEVDE